MKRHLLLGAMALAVACGAGPASAGQVFICEDGHVTTVATVDLEAKKRTDPCVAAHFGLEIRAESVPLPMRRPVRPAVVVEAADPVAPPAATHTGSSSDQHVETVAKSAPGLRGSRMHKRSALQERLAALGAGDYRRVKVINATGSGGWHRHAR